jgi:hypothetical protein
MRLIDRYLDGDLSGTEAEAFLDSLASDPRLEAELREYERILGTGAPLGPEGPSPGFTDRVMARLGEPEARGRRWPFPSGRSAWRWGLAWGVAAVLAFSLGRFTAGDRALPAPDSVPGPAAASAPDEAGRFRLVRLVYVPPDPGVEHVAVAGTFNEWNPSRTQMQREGGLWTAQLLLPRNTYEYMFVVDGEQWVTDPLAVETRDDGFGRENAVLDLTL